MCRFVLVKSLLNVIQLLLGCFRQVIIRLMAKSRFEVV